MMMLLPRRHRATLRQLGAEAQAMSMLRTKSLPPFGSIGVT